MTTLVTPINRPAPDTLIAQQHSKNISHEMKWHKLLARLTVWLAAEILLNWLGLDNLADYGEFLFEHREIAIRPIAQLLLVNSLGSCQLAQTNGFITGDRLL